MYTMNDYVRQTRLPAGPSWTTGPTTASAPGAGRARVCRRIRAVRRPSEASERALNPTSARQESTHATMMGPVAGSHRARPLVGRDAELTSSRPCSASARRPDATRSAPSCSPATPASARPGSSPSCATSPSPRAGRSFAGHCLDFGDSALPYLPFSEVIGRLATDLPDVVDTVAGSHPALARLQPGRRVLGSEPRRGDEPRRSTAATCSTPSTRCSRRRPPRRPLLLVIEDTHWADQSTRDLLSFLFSRPFVGPVAMVASYRSDDLHRRHPLRKPGRGVGPHPRRRPPAAPPAGRPTTSARLVHELHPTPLTETESPTSSTAPRATPSSSRSWSAPPPARAAGCPTTWPTCCWSGSTGSTTQARQVVRTASVAGRRVTHDMLERGVRASTPTASTRACARPSRRTSCWRHATATTPSATPCSARRSTTTCCPASGSGCTRRTPRPSPGPRPRHRGRAGPARPAGP